MTYDLVHLDTFAHDGEFERQEEGTGRVDERKEFAHHVQPSSEHALVPLTTETVLQLPSSEAYS